MKSWSILIAIGIVCLLAATSVAAGQAGENWTINMNETPATDIACHVTGYRGPVRKIVVGTARVVVGTVKVVQRVKPVRRVLRVAVGVPLRVVGRVALRVHRRPLLRARFGCLRCRCCGLRGIVAQVHYLSRK